MDTGALQAFRRHWRRFSGTGAAPSKIRAAEAFIAWAGDGHPDFWRGRRVLDAGCGDGVHARLLHAMGAHVTGLDFCLADLRHRPPVILVNADVTVLPLRSASFDVVFAYGFLYYLADPRQGFRELARAVAPGGRFIAWNFSPPAGVWIALLLLRRLTAWGGDRLGMALSYLLAPLFSFLPTASGVSLLRDGPRATAELIYVHLLPSPFQKIPLEQMAGWLDEAGFTIERLFLSPSYGVVARKR